MMKKLFTLLAILSLSIVSAQAFKGKGDIKAQVGALLQDKVSGIQVSADFGIGENMSYGFVGSYLLGASGFDINDARFQDRFDAKARFNANLGNVFELDEKMDIYPGLDLGIKNFGAHLGFRYFFTDGFGVFTEAGIPIAKYDSDAPKVNNQFGFTFGASFNL
jgi:hypothetical protein